MFEGFDKITDHASDQVGGQYRRREKVPDYKDFFEPAFNVLEPGTQLNWNWHIGYLCDQLQAEVERISRGEPSNGDMIINIMPRSLKSYLCTILLNGWAWAKYPSMKFITVSYADPLAVEHSGKTRKLLKSDWYQDHFGDSFTFDKSQDAKGYFRNNQGGERKATSVGGQITGSGSNILIIDDPVKPPSNDEITINLNEIHTANNWHDSTFYNRVNDPDVDMRIYVMQRLHNNDLTGYISNKENQEFKHISIPGEFKKSDEDNDDVDLEIKPKKLKKHYKPDEHFSNYMLFFRDRFSKGTLKTYQENMGDNYSGQVLQSPSKKGGNIWKDEYFTRITYEQLPPRKGKEGTGWDLATSKSAKKDNSSTAFVYGFRWQGVIYVTECGWFFDEFPEVVESIKEGKPPHWIENKSAGKDAVPSLKRDGIDAREHKNENRDKFQMASFGAKKAKKHQICVLSGIYSKLVTGEKQGLCEFPSVIWDDLHDAFCIFLENMTDGIMTGEDVKQVIAMNKKAGKANSPSIASTMRGSSFRGHSI